jgi:clan AA aspartic protease (TIGR02281 family)
MILFTGDSQAEFYKYIDKNGKPHFVDDPGKIPQEYKELKVYKEKYDHLSDTEKAATIEKDRREELQRLETEKAAEEQQVQEQFSTKVMIHGNQVLVPVTLGYHGKEVDTLLVLDTGASIIALHKDVAKRLSIYDTEKSRAQVAGGKEIDTEMVKLSYVKLGPYKKQNLDAAIISYKGMPSDYNGLLGMNFLRGLEYSIDFERQIIKWK